MEEAETVRFAAQDAAYQGRLEEAAELYAQSIRIAPMILTPYQGYSAVLERQGRFAEALDVMEQKYTISVDVWTQENDHDARMSRMTSSERRAYSESTSGITYEGRPTMFADVDAEWGFTPEGVSILARLYVASGNFERGMAVFGELLSPQHAWFGTPFPSWERQDDCDGLGVYVASGYIDMLLLAGHGEDARIYSQRFMDGCFPGWQTNPSATAGFQRFSVAEKMMETARGR